ncbi:hypothetical protein [Streptomyces megasporus]|uniref:hypothetical protein n=1 Tax=Streptomyces megasporus TaxID=44060 RepID=UPI0004E1A864|nr:hypothetical protein [Streptomyces megasporus]
MRRITRSALPVCVGIAALLSGVSGLSGCTVDGAPAPERSSAGPTATTTAPPDTAIRLAERYRRQGGAEDVYGIRWDPGSDGAPRVVVWTRDPDGGAAALEALDESILRFLRGEEGFSSERGHLLDVFGPDGGLRNRYDTRP